MGNGAVSGSPEKPFTVISRPLLKSYSSAFQTFWSLLCSRLELGHRVLEAQRLVSAQALLAQNSEHAHTRAHTHTHTHRAFTLLTEGGKNDLTGASGTPNASILVISFRDHGHKLLAAWGDEVLGFCAR